MLTAIIDDGVYEEYFNNPPLLQHLQVNSNNEVEEETGEPFASHGTICTAIINDLCKNSELISIKILDETGCGYVEQLISALNWCYRHHIRLIQMSLGTADYHDFHKIEPVIHKLTTNGTLIVSAYNNMNIPSYPAHLPGVFGVRNDRYYLLENGTFLFDSNSNLREENSLVSNYSKILIDKDGFSHTTEGSNSFAAPVITAHIITYINNKPTLTYQEILSNLKFFSCNLQYPDTFCNFEHWSKKEITVPVICIRKDDVNSFKKLYQMFTKDNYAVEGLSETTSETTDIIPLHLYNTANVSQGLIYTLYKVYQPSLILIESNSIMTNWSFIDIYIEWKNNYQVYTEGKIECMENLLNVYKAILLYFNN
jgi:hypothetical protein